MNLRRTTIAAHGLLAVVLGVAAAWLLWLSFSQMPDPMGPWPVGPGFLAVPMAVGMMAVIAVLGLGVKSWMGSGSRAALGVPDLLAAGTLFVVEDGRLAVLEVFTYDDPWPDEVLNWTIAPGGVTHLGRSATDIEQVEAAWVPPDGSPDIRRR